MLTPFWPSTGKGTAILTTRNPDTARYFTNTEGRLNISPFSLTDGQNFLLNVVKGGWQAEKDEPELTAANDICQSVACLPLALDLVGSYISSCEISLSRFVKMHPGFERDLLFDGSVKPSDVNPYQKSITTTWTLTSTFSKSGPIMETKARTLIQMLAFLDASGVPLSLFEEKQKEDMWVNSLPILIPVRLLNILHVIRLQSCFSFLFSSLECSLHQPHYALS